MLARREFLAAASLAAAKPQNVLIFMTDQESALLPGPVTLPNRRRLLSGATQFTNAFCNTPQCSPARAALLTGLQPHRTGVVTNVDGGSLGKALKPEIPTIGDVFSAGGYATGYFGKWHLGSHQGGFAEQKQVSDQAAAEAAAAWIRDQNDKPWLCWVSILDPHHIYDIPSVLAGVKPRPGVRPPKSGLENLVGKPVAQRAFVDQDQGRQTREFTPADWIKYRSFYCELVEKTDRALGVVLDAVPNLNSAIVAYTTDHGDALGEHGLPYKGPFMYDELLRIPFAIRAAKLKPGVRADLTTQTDLSPTLASLVGLRWPSKVDGRDLSQTKSAPNAVFLEYYSKQKWVNPIRTIRTAKWKLNWYDTDEKELYDLAADPNELRNLAGSHPVQASLEARLTAWRGKLGASSDTATKR